MPAVDRSCGQYFCGPPNCIRTPIQAEGLAPYATISFPQINFSNATSGGSNFGYVAQNNSPNFQQPDLTVGNNSNVAQNNSPNFNPNQQPDLTVGNNSNTSGNHAVIKSFQYGGSTGNGAEIEIFDEQGGEFDLFISKMAVFIKDTFSYSCTIQWGWIVTKCNGGGTSCISSSKHNFLINTVEMNYSSGGITFKLELQDMMEPLFETRADNVIKDVDLKGAIRQLFLTANPPIPVVRFVSRNAGAISSGFKACSLISPDNNGSGYQTPPTGLQLASCANGTANRNSPNPFAGVDQQATNPNFKGNDSTTFDFRADADGTRLVASGYKQTDWSASGKTPFAAVRDWLNNEVSAAGYGTIIFWNSIGKIPELIIMESPLPKCYSNLDDSQCKNSLGTYIVNGGIDSPVFSFDPKIHFTFATAAQSGAVVEEGGAAKGTPPDKCEENLKGNDPKGIGTTNFGAYPQQFKDRYGPGNGNLLMQALAANEKANKQYENIEAELRIQGDPTLDDPFLIQVRTVSIVVINPFHVSYPDNASGPGCPTWLQAAPCNNILSNRNWFIKGVSHEIKEGSYTTTLSLYLVSPTHTTTLG